MAGRPKGIVTQAMVTSAKKRLQETGKGHTVTLSQGKWLHFGTTVSRCIRLVTMSLPK